ncbi:AAA-like domain-containing protein [Aphanothece sacrum]|uniref:WD40 repeat-containing protein n=1 Tax=Aphanothece sacrum FPU1 TaxID=1920663 RepID=A0A401IMX4_APHSA|nr:AAA-like domain-containing protein [Aphanothece sacrum]GBF82597.1 WD40 repeat-containing protein [Aphanothece sacrum FPU1]GBF84731.1 WD repeat-containing protein [Aphanothece sacrum FPU3]
MNQNLKQSYTYKVGGSLSFDHPTYVERKADKELLSALEAGKFCYIFNCRQMGKSSLRVRTMHQLQREGMSCASVDITSLGSDISQQQWYSGIITQLFLGFNLVGKVNLKVWLRERDELSGVQKFSHFLEEILLIHCPGEKIYIFIDEIDKVLSLNFSLDDFFTLIRFCYNQRAENAQFNRLVFALFGVATPSDLIRDKTQTPFNIGQPIELTGFTPEEISPLVSGLTPITDNPQEVLNAILDWTGGQPFLTQKVCQLLFNSLEKITAGQEIQFIKNIVESLIINHWESQDEPVHLKTIRDRLFRHEKRVGRLLGLYQHILQEGSVQADDSPEQTEIRLSGLVVKKDSKLFIYNRVYQEVFNQKWVSKQLENIRPYSESISAWITSNYEDNSRLLRGKALKDALVWALDKSLGNIDYQFLSASQNLDKREAEFNLATEKEANEILTQANQKAQRMIRLGIGVLIISLVGAVIAISQTRYAFEKQEEAQKGTQLEQTGDSAWRQFEFEQIEGLMSAIQAGQELKYLVKDQRFLQDYPATSPILALEQILDHIQQKNKLTGHRDTVNSVSFSPDGQLIATASNDGTVRLWNWQGNQLKLLTGHQKNVYSVAFSPNGQLIATASQDDTAKIWNREGKQLITLKGHYASVYSVTFSPDSQRIATTSRDNTAIVWDLQGHSLAILKGHQKSVDDVAFSPDGTLIATASRDGTVKVWNNQGRLLNTIRQDSLPFYSISFSPNGKQLAAAADDGTVRIWDQQGHPLLTLKGHQGLVNSVNFSRNGQWIVTAGNDGTARLWNVQGQTVAIFRGHQDPVYDVAISADSQRVATASGDGTVKLWQVKSPQQQGFDTFDNYVTSGDVSSKEKILAIASENGMVYLWNLEGKKLTQFQAHGSSINSLSFSPDGQTIATGASNGIVKLWDLQGKLLATLSDNFVQIYSLTFSGDGHWLAMATREGKVWLWNVQSIPPKLVKNFTAHEDTIYHLSFSSDQQFLATASGDGTAKLWDLQGHLKKEFSGHQDRVNWLSFSPDGHYLATASKDSTVKLWDIKGQLLRTLKSDLFPVSLVSFSPNGNYLATASRDGTIKLWDINGNLHTKMKGHQESIESLQFTPDSQQMITVARDGTVRIWTVQEEFARLNYLLNQGCKWLQDYVANRPQEKVKLSGCFD